MRSVGIKILKNRLSEYVKIAAAGEVVLITDGDRVVAELTPPASGRARQLPDAALAEAVRMGWIIPPLMREGELPRTTPVGKLEEILDDLRKDRAAR